MVKSFLELLFLKKKFRQEPNLYSQLQNIYKASLADYCYIFPSCDMDFVMPLLYVFCDPFIQKKHQILFRTRRIAVDLQHVKMLLLNFGEAFGTMFQTALIFQSPQQYNIKITPFTFMHIACILHIVQDMSLFWLTWGFFYISYKKCGLWKLEQECLDTLNYLTLQ